MGNFCPKKCGVFEPSCTTASDLNLPSRNKDRVNSISSAVKKQRGRQKSSKTIPSENRRGQRSAPTAGKKAHKDGNNQFKRPHPNKKNGSRSGPISPVDISPSIIHLMPGDDNDTIKHIASKLGMEVKIVEIVVKMLENENTIPFIARYRRAQTFHSDADQLRIIKEAYDRSRKIKLKAHEVIKSIQKRGKLTNEVRDAVLSSKSLDELKKFQVLYEKNSMCLLAEKTSESGVHLAIAQEIIEGTKMENFRKYLDSKKDGLQREEEIQDGVILTLAYFILKDKRVTEMIQKLRANIVLQIETERMTIVGSSDENSDIEDFNKNECEKKGNKYEMYYEWSGSEKNISPHQILEINHARSKKIISIQLSLPDQFEKSLLQFVLELFPAAAEIPFNCGLLTKAFKKAFIKSIKPTVSKRKYSELSEKAEEAQLEIFARNAKQQFLRSPGAKGKVVLGIDPEYEKTWKLAVVSAEGDVLETLDDFQHPKSPESKLEAIETISRIVKEHKCEIIAIGNGKNHKDTEAFLSELIADGTFAPVDVSYTIVDKSGTLQHSRGAEAVMEFPDMNTSLISAISIARRFQNPLAEYAKIDMKLLSASLHTYNLPRAKLISKLNEVIMEAVSFVGVDVNTASHCLLRRVAGLTPVKAANIIAYRHENGPFINRNMLKNVKGIDDKTFEQCAGFLRIITETSSRTSKTFKNFKFTKANGADEKNDRNSLDQTWIHPESYELAEKFIEACNVNLKDLGTPKFVATVKTFSAQGLGSLAKRFETDEETLDVIVKGLMMLKGEDVRTGNDPFFRKTLRSISDLSAGELLSGEVRNVTDFGAFVDIGVGRDGLIHIKDLRGQVLMFSQKVDVKIQKIRKVRINLELMKAYQFTSIYY